MGEYNKPQRWSRYHRADKFCAVKSVINNSVSLFCEGRFDEREPHEDAAHPPEHLRCLGCVGALRAARLAYFADDTIDDVRPAVEEVE